MITVKMCIEFIKFLLRIFLRKALYGHRLDDANDVENIAVFMSEFYRFVYSLMITVYSTVIRFMITTCS